MPVRSFLPVAAVALASGAVSACSSFRSSSAGRAKFALAGLIVD
jgi:hypothetical protein